MEDEDEVDEVEVVLSWGLLEEDGAAPADEKDGPLSPPPPAAAADSPPTPCCLGTPTPTAAAPLVLVAAMAAAERVRGFEGAATVVVDCREEEAVVAMASVICLFLSRPFCCFLYV